ncbi:serpin family protein [Infirmifilum lucidum]|uniref:Serpin family protein n=1 Tax=Infirmifilum lucidum TaxID=2776706 RepID=A0A7L9FIK0_9CREN|nr:serpin family protein [Infirmifilum lucidum]QOJ78853.1 serpin family protein [Infirmifilum lucidum]
MKLESIALAVAGAVLIAAIVAVASLYLYPYSPSRPPLANEINYTASGVEEVVKSNNLLALKLYKQLAGSGDGNVFASPFSVYSALAIVYEGARGATAEEFRSALGYPSIGALRPNYARVYNYLNSIGGVELAVGNAIWVQRGFELLPEYSSAVAEYYGARASNLDFVGDPEGSRLTINRFIEEQTRGKIKNLMPRGSIDPLTRLVVTNAVYFKGSWLYAFDKRMTFESDFVVSEGRTVRVPMMCMEPSGKKFMYADLGEAKVLELPYSGSGISMVIVLPKGSLRGLEAGLSLEKLKGYIAALKPEELDRICIPRFELEEKYFLNEHLQGLDLRKVFTPDADLSGIDGRRDLYVSLVVHQAYVKVDEEGTEAAGATAVVVTLTAVVPEKTFVADHPFLFLIRDRETGLILFIGRVVDPTAK